VNVYRVNTAGKEQVIHVFRAGDSFAEVALAVPTGYPADARALAPRPVCCWCKTSGFWPLVQAFGRLFDLHQCAGKQFEAG